MKIVLACIFKDDTEIGLAERMLASFMPYVQGLAVAITGTSGKSQKLRELVKKYGGRYVITTPATHPRIYSKSKESFLFSNFAEARNVSFQLAEQMNPDWLMWADIDDILFYGEQLKDIADKAKKNKVDAVYFTYWYAVQVDKKGNVTNVVIEHLRERLLKPGVFKWISRLHEVAVPKDDAYKPKYSDWSFNPDEKRFMVWAHLPTEKQVLNNLYRNREILQVQFEEEKGKDPRTLFYLAKTDVDISQLEKKPNKLIEAEGLFKKYLEMSGWDEERANAWEYLGNIYDIQNQHHKAIEAYHNGLREHPVHHLLYLRLVKKYMDLKEWEKAEWWLGIAMNLETPKTRTTIGNPLEVKVTAAGLKYNLAIAKQDLKEALKWYRTRQKLLNGPIEDDYTKTLESALEMDNAARWIYNYAVWLNRNKKKKQLKHILKTLPPELKKEQFAQIIANEIQPSRKWPDKSIVYYAGQSFEDWSPKSLSKGLGGSETAIVELSREWVKKGYKVTVYANLGPEEGIYEGVEYRHFAELNWKDHFDTFIVWRNPGILDLDIKSNRIWYDAHDIESNTAWTPERVKKLTKAFFKSKWHRGNVPNIPDKKAVVISNGIYV